jgi:hypothetical protein
LNESVEGSTIRLQEPWLRPGTSVLIGPPESRVRGVIYRSHLSQYCDGSHFVEYDVEWWDDRVLYRSSFHSSDLVLAPEVE